MQTLLPVSVGRSSVSSRDLRRNVTTTLGAADAPISPATTSYQPSARRPIADGFRSTARGTVSFCVRHGIHPDVISYFSVVAAGVGAGCFLWSQRHPWLLLI